MQATTPTHPAPEPDSALARREALTRDMFALASYLMRRSNVRTFNTIAELDLSFTQIKALCALDEDESGRSVKALAESMGVSLPAMSRAIDGLHDRGFVDRREDPIDRRMKRVGLTEAGHAMTDSLTQGRLEGIQEFLSTLDHGEASALENALALILAQRPEIAELRPGSPQTTTPATPTGRTKP